MRSTASTIIRPSRRLVFAAAAVIIGLSACGDAETPSASDLPVIAIGSAGDGKLAAGAMAADERMSIMPYYNVDYVWAGQEAGATTSTAWRYQGEVTEADVARIAAALGVAGTPAALPADQGGGWVVGPQDGSAPSVTVSTDGLGSWWFNAPYSGPVVECVLPVDTDPTDSVVPVEECPEPTPPEGVPTEDEALAATEDLLAALGVDRGAVELEAYADDWSANTTVFPLIDGSRTQMAWSFGFGENGALQWASGALLEPVVVGDYPLVGCEAGVARLNDEANAWLGGGGVPMPADDLARSSGAAGVPEPAPLPDDQVLIDPAAPVDTTPVVVTLTSCSVERMPVWAADGTVWLLPSYLFTADDGGQYSVIAIDDQFLQPPTETVTTEVPVTEVPVDPPTTDLPATTVPGTDVPVTEVPNTVIGEPTVEEAQVLVGLPIADAEQLAGESGWTVRVMRIDGEDQAGTMDLRTERVNVEIADGVVVAILSVG